jgi:hypothetical protein
VGSYRGRDVELRAVVQFAIRYRASSVRIWAAVGLMVMPV